MSHYPSTAKANTVRPQLHSRTTLEHKIISSVQSLTATTPKQYGGAPLMEAAYFLGRMTSADIMHEVVSPHVQDFYHRQVLFGFAQVEDARKSYVAGSDLPRVDDRCFGYLREAQFYFLSALITPEVAISSPQQDFAGTDMIFGRKQRLWIDVAAGPRTFKEKVAEHDGTDTGVIYIPRNGLSTFNKVYEELLFGQHFNYTLAELPEAIGSFRAVFSSIFRKDAVAAINEVIEFNNSPTIAAKLPAIPRQTVIQTLNLLRQ